jgi:hypothetical protein
VTAGAVEADGAVCSCVSDHEAACVLMLPAR